MPVSTRFFTHSFLWFPSRESGYRCQGFAGDGSRPRYELLKHSGSWVKLMIALRVRCLGTSKVLAPSGPARLTIPLAGNLTAMVWPPNLRQTPLQLPQSTRNVGHFPPLPKERSWFSHRPPDLHDWTPSGCATMHHRIWASRCVYPSDLLDKACSCLTPSSSSKATSDGGQCGWKKGMRNVVFGAATIWSAAGQRLPPLSYSA